MNTSASAGALQPSRRKWTAAKPTTCSHCRNLLWPGDTSFDDLDDEEFEDGVPDKDV